MWSMAEMAPSATAPARDLFIQYQKMSGHKTDEIALLGHLNSIKVGGFYHDKRPGRTTRRPRVEAGYTQKVGSTGRRTVREVVFT